MRRIYAMGAAAAAAAVLVGFTADAPVMAQQKACLHTSGDPVQAARLKQALSLTRHVNTQQSGAFSAAKTYLPLGQLTLTQPVPEGFVLKLAADTEGYAFSVIDQTDPCRLGFFSNQDGLIFRGQPLQ
jgi:hypothetical protein